jgi:Flp pilus assembly protein TadD
MKERNARNLIEEGKLRESKGFRARAALLYGRVSKNDALYPEAMTRLGSIRLSQKRYSEAADAFRETIRSIPDSPEAWSGLGSIAHERGDFIDAERALRVGILLAPGRFETLAALFETQISPQRIRLGRWCFCASPRDGTLRTESAFAVDLWHSGQISRAAQRVRRSLVFAPHDPTVLFNLGNMLRDLGQKECASRLYNRALQITGQASSGASNILNNLGLLSFWRGDWQDAASLFKRAAHANPAHAVAWANCARSLQMLGETKPVAEAYKRSLLMEPADLLSTCEVAGLLASILWAHRARALGPYNAKPYNRLAVLATQSPGRAGVLRWLRLAAVLEPNHADTWFNICVELGREGDAVSAAKYGAYAANIDEEHASAHLNTAFALLLQERFDAGWAFHRRRLETPQAAAVVRKFNIPMWAGDTKFGRHILVWGEQGIGDEIQFLTLIPYLLEQGYELTILTEPRLRSLIKRSFPSVAVPDVGAPTGQTEAHYGADCHIAIGDLPYQLRLFCGGEAMPQPWLVPKLSTTVRLRKELEARHPGKVLVGITWRSIAPKTGAQRTIKPELWRSLAGIEGFAFVSLQYGATDADIEEFARDADLRVDLQHGVEPLEDLDGLSSLIAAMDLVISPANNTVHFAGAMAKPCWTLVPSVADWRWGLTRSDSLWYPRSRVYRQQTLGDWAPVLVQVASDLRKLK